MQFTHACLTSTVVYQTRRWSKGMDVFLHPTFYMDVITYPRSNRDAAGLANLC